MPGEWGRECHIDWRCQVERGGRGLTCLLSAQLWGGPRTLGPGRNIQELPEAVKESIRA